MNNLLMNKATSIQNPLLGDRLLDGTGTCDYRGNEFGSKDYPDSFCRTGYLYRIDKLHIGGDTPCPKCNPKRYKKMFSNEEEEE